MSLDIIENLKRLLADEEFMNRASEQVTRILITRERTDAGETWCANHCDPQNWNCVGKGTRIRTALERLFENLENQGRDDALADLNSFIERAGLKM